MSHAVHDLKEQRDESADDAHDRHADMRRRRPCRKRRTNWRVVYVGTEFAGAFNVLALNSANGNRLRGFQTGNEVFSSRTIANGVLYVGSNDDSIYAFQLGP